MTHGHEQWCGDCLRDWGAAGWRGQGGNIMTTVIELLKYNHCPKTPFLLVGTQIDLRDDPSTIEKLAKNKQKPITPETAEKLARDLKAAKYVECSALTQKGLKNVQYLKKQYRLLWSLQN